MADCLSLCLVGTGEWTQVIRFAASTYPPRCLPHFSPLILTETALHSEHHFKTCLMHREGAGHKYRQCTPREMSAFFLRGPQKCGLMQTHSNGSGLDVFWMDGCSHSGQERTSDEVLSNRGLLPSVAKSLPQATWQHGISIPLKKETLLSHTLLFK